jgi:hypothetical protein
MSTAYPQKVSPEPFPEVDFGSRFPLLVSEKFPTPGAPRGFERGLYACSDLYCPGRGLSPNGDRCMHIGSLRGEWKDVYFTQSPLTTGAL